MATLAVHVYDMISHKKISFHCGVFFKHEMVQSHTCMELILASTSMEESGVGLAGERGGDGCIIIVVMSVEK